MKIAITGHSAGIGKSFASLLESRGHQVIGLSRRNGKNIRSLHKILGDIIDCDMFINNAQEGFAQTELLYKVWHQWRDKDKLIWIIGSLISTNSKVDENLEEYKLQKQTLDQAFINLKNQPSKCKLVIIRPGVVATQPHNNVGIDSADVDAWTKTICDMWDSSVKNNLYLQEISLRFKKGLMQIGS